MASNAAVEEARAAFDTVVLEGQEVQARLSDVNTRLDRAKARRREYGFHAISELEEERCGLVDDYRSVNQRIVLARRALAAAEEERRAIARAARAVRGQSFSELFMAAAKDILPGATFRDIADAAQTRMEASDGF